MFNTLSRTKENFVPISSGTVKMYSCGPTVYNSASIGNMRAYIFTDILKRALRHIGGFEIFDVINITDVGHLQSDADDGEDKVELAARKAQLKPLDIAKKYRDEFMADCASLNIHPPKVQAPATSYVAQMIDHIKLLEEKGFTYQTSEGIYFDASRFPDYYALRGSAPKIDIAGKRITMGEKRGMSDFCLWRFTPQMALQKFPSPWGIGIPGWHIECSAIARNYLGDQFDIHTGGVDHIPIHHTNERAQTQSLTNKPMTQIWMHNEFIKVNGTKMSKSLGNAYTLPDLIAHGFSPVHFRYLCLLTHYRTIMNFTFDSLSAARKAYENIIKFLAKHFVAPNSSKKLDSKKLKEEFARELSDDLNTPKSLALLWKILDQSPAREIYDLALEFDKVLGLSFKQSAAEFLSKQANKQDIPANILDMAKERFLFKKSRDFQRADKLRDEIKDQGYEIIDTADGYEVKPII